MAFFFSSSFLFQFLARKILGSLACKDSKDLWIIVWKLRSANACFNYKSNSIHEIESEREVKRDVYVTRLAAVQLTFKLPLRAISMSKFKTRLYRSSRQSILYIFSMSLCLFCEEGLKWKLDSNIRPVFRQMNWRWFNSVRIIFRLFSNSLILRRRSHVNWKSSLYRSLKTRVNYELISYRFNLTRTFVVRT